MKNTIEMDGKKYIEFDVARQLKYQKIKDIIILILILFAIVSLVIAISVLVKNRDIINKDPLIIGMDRHGFVSCQCSNQDGTQWFSTQTGFKTEPVPLNNFTNLLSSFIAASLS